MRRVAIIGVGMSHFGEMWNKSFRELIAEAGLMALEDANIESEDIQALYGGTMASGRLIGQEHIASLIADHMGFKHIPATRVEDACASGGVALRQGYLAVASGAYDIVAVGGVEKMTDVSTAEVTYGLGGAGDEEWELFQGATFPGIYAMMARRHMYEFGTTEEQMAMVAVKNHENAYKNKYAQFHRLISVDDVLKSKKVADPIKVLDSSPITDGAAVAILAPVEIAKKYNDAPVEIIGSAQASDTIALHDRKTLTGIEATQIAAREAYKQAKVQPKDIQVAEVHDCFTIAEIMAIEDLGFFKKGEGGKATEEGLTKIGGKVAVNTSGGLKGCGHPVGATGVKQAVEITWQLRGEAEGRNTNAEIGLTHNVGGSGGTVVVHILKRL